MGQIHSTEKIIEYLWPDNKKATPNDVQQFIYCLRKKIEKVPTKPCFLHNVPGYGYKLEYMPSIPAECSEIATLAGSLAWLCFSWCSGNPTEISFLERRLDNSKKGGGVGQIGYARICIKSLANFLSLLSRKEQLSTPKSRSLWINRNGGTGGIIALELVVAYCAQCSCVTGHSLSPPFVNLLNFSLTYFQDANAI